MVKVLIIYYSEYGHIHKMAQAAAEGARSVSGAEVTTLSADVLAKMGASEIQKGLDAEVPIMHDPNEMANYDAIIFGTPTRFGNMCGQMKQFLDSTGKLWATNGLKDKVGAVFSSSNTQHGGQESTILSTHIVLLHHGMLLAGLPYSFKEQNGVDEIKGCSPYGASTIAGPDGSRQPTKTELAGASYQAKRAAELAADLIAGRKARA